MANEPSRRRFLRGAGLLAIGGLAGCTLPTGSQETDGNTPTATDPGDGTQNPEGTPTAIGDSPYTRAYREVIDSVVLIRTYTPLGGGSGSGFAYRSSEYLLTNQHVVANASKVEVRFNEGEWKTAEIVGTDVYSDLAVLRVDSPPDYVEPLDLVSQDPPVGARVLAVGNPYQFDRSVSAGIVSGVNRSIGVNPNQPGGFQIPDAVQTDAAVNPGNSGGPLVTMDGEVAGIIRSGGGENIGFAVSAALIERVAPELIENGEYDHSYMGIGTYPVSPTVAEANDLDAVRGVMVSAVRDGGPADGVLQERTDLRDVNGVTIPIGGDVIVAMDGTQIDTGNDLSTFLALETSPGDTIEITVIRDGSRQTVELTLGERPAPSGA